jgi:hypothetical protein
MTPFASVALIRRNGTIIFRPPRKEQPGDISQARKTAARRWRASLASDEKLVKVLLMREVDGKLEVSERGDTRREWTAYRIEPARAATEPHLAALMAEIGVDPDLAPPAMPDVLIVNGIEYRRVA